MKNTYVIVYCEELRDQYECDANRTPILVLEDVDEDCIDLVKFHKYGYEIYIADTNGNLKKIQEYEDYGWTEEDDD